MIVEKETNDYLNIGVFGDSVGKGIILRDGSERYEVMKVDVGELFGQDNIHIQNYSVMGSTISKGLSIVKRHIESLPEYRNVFLEFGGNDCDFAWNDIAEDPDKKHIQKTSLAEFIEIYTQIIDIIRQNGSQPIILSLPPLDSDRYYNWVSKRHDRTHKENILKWLVCADSIYRWQEMYNLKIVLLAAKLSVPLIDIRSAFLMNFHYKDLLCEDGIHPNKNGYELIYKTIGEQYIL